MFALLAIALMGVDHFTAYLGSIRYQLSGAVAAIQYAVDSPFLFVERIANNFTYQQDLIQENSRLKAEKLLLQAKLQQLAAIEKENQQLRQLTKTTVSAKNKIMAARILAIASEPAVHEIVIGAGTSQGVYVGQPVLSANGIMGQVVQVGKLTSRVMLLSDVRSAIPVEVVRTGVRSIVVGDSQVDSLLMQYIPKTTDIKVGDQLISSGLGQRYPVAYPVGRVVAVSSPPNDTFARIVVKPAVIFAQQHLVLLLWTEHRDLTQEVDSQLTAMDQEAQTRRNLTNGVDVS